MQKKPPKNSLVKNKPSSDAVNAVYERIALVIREARTSIIRSVDTTMVKAYWHIGQHLFEVEQSGAKRAGYGKELLQTIAIKLSQEFGRGFSISTLEDIRKFYLAYPIPHTLCGELGVPQFSPHLS